MIDWLTLRIPRDQLAPATVEFLLSQMSFITKHDCNGEIVWRTNCRESIRSDSHQITAQLGARGLELTGSPARLFAHDNVFGSGDIQVCARAMLSHVSAVIGHPLPDTLDKMTVGRVDVTHNYDLGGPTEVRQALNCLRHAEGGRLQVRTESETVYWSPKSRHRSAKAYHKGPHLRYQCDRGQASAYPWQIAAADRLLRLELSLRNEWWRRHGGNWWEITESELNQIHYDFFKQCIGQARIVSMDKLLDVCQQVAKTPGQGKAAYRTFCSIRHMGTDQARALMPRSTWMRHRKILIGAGLSVGDLHSAEILPFRRKAIALDCPVRSWDELRAAA